MKYFSSGPLIFVIASLLFFSYAVKRFSEAHETSWVAISIGIGILLFGGLVGYIQYQRNKE